LIGGWGLGWWLTGGRWRDEEGRAGGRRRFEVARQSKGKRWVKWDRGGGGGGVRDGGREQEEKAGGKSR